MKSIPIATYFHAEIQPFLVDSQGGHRVSQFRKQPVTAPKIRIRPCLFNSSLIEHNDSVGVSQCRQAMCHNDYCSAVHKFLETFLDILFVDVIQRGRRFIEQDNSGLAQDDPGYR